MATKHQHKHSSPQCPFASSVCIVGDVWNLLILRTLLGGEKRFTELQELIPGISKSILSDRLKTLYTHNLISRSRVASMPPSVTYALCIPRVHIEKLIEAYSTIGNYCMTQQA